MIKRADFNQDHKLILEAAIAIGFKPAADNATVFVCTDEQLIEFSIGISQALFAQVLLYEQPSGTA